MSEFRHCLRRSLGEGTGHLIEGTTRPVSSVCRYAPPTSDPERAFGVGEQTFCLPWQR